jgi:hypothetical protein
MMLLSRDVSAKMKESSLPLLDYNAADYGMDDEYLLAAVNKRSSNTSTECRENAILVQRDTANSRALRFERFARYRNDVSHG